MINEVQEEVIILNVMRYSNEKGEGCRVSLIFCEKSQDSKNFKGCPVVDQFYTNPKVFDKISEDFRLTPVLATLSFEPNPNNPLRTRSIITRLENDEDVVVDLV